MQHDHVGLVLSNDAYDVLISMKNKLSKVEKGIVTQFFNVFSVHVTKNNCHMFIWSEIEIPSVVKTLLGMFTKKIDCADYLLLTVHDGKYYINGCMINNPFNMRLMPVIMHDA